jgi:Tol biopolymer transport system component
MNMMTTLLAIAVVLAQVASARTVQVSTPAQAGTIDTGKLKGEPTQLSWSPDGTQLFLQTSERDAKGMTTSPRFFVMAASGGKPEAVDAPPGWASDYWTWKSNKFPPGSSTQWIEVTPEDRKVVATASPMGGDLARGGTSGDPNGGGTSAGEVASRAAQTQIPRVFTLTFKGETVGEFVNQQFLPGYTFGWSPKELGMVTYTNQAGRLAIMDLQGQKQQIAATRNVILPAWSLDGKRIAFLQKAGKNKYDLFIANVTP